MQAVLNVPLVLRNPLAHLPLGLPVAPGHVYRAPRAALERPKT
jgi:hypothetical protein